jgi:hypothetical protein
VVDEEGRDLLHSDWLNSRNQPLEKVKFHNSKTPISSIKNISKGNKSIPILIRQNILRKILFKIKIDNKLSQLEVLDKILQNKFPNKILSHKHYTLCEESHDFQLISLLHQKANISFFHFHQQF